MLDRSPVWEHISDLGHLKGRINRYGLRELFDFPAPYDGIYEFSVYSVSAGVQTDLGIVVNGGDPICQALPIGWNQGIIQL